MTEERYTRDRLVDRARELGFSTSGRFIDEWIRLGLLAPPLAPGRGRAVGGRSKGTWRGDQFLLFSEIVQGRVAKVPIPVLCNLAAYDWLVYGDEMVPLSQVRRALATWAGAGGGRSPWRSAQETARAVVAELEHPKARVADKKRLEDIIALAAFRGRLDEGALDAAQRVFDPEGEGRWRGPSGMELTATDYVRQVSQLLRVRSLLASPDQSTVIPDRQFYSARLALGAGIVRYGTDQRDRGSDPENAPLFPPLTEEAVALSSCRAISMMLNFAIEADEGSLPGFERLKEEGAELLGGYETSEDFATGHPSPPTT